jgi:hypothetical protein
MNKKVKKILWIVGLVLALALIGVWIYFGTASPDKYSYEGYIVATRKSGGDTVITTISGDTKNEFTLKWYTKKNFSGTLNELKEGAFIKLNTTGKGSSNIRNFSAYEGFSMEGKVVYFEGKAEPYILTIGKTVKYYMLYAMIPSQDVDYQLETGTQIKAYYQYPLNASTEKVVVDVIEKTSDILSPLTEEEIAYIGRMGFKVAGK